MSSTPDADSDGDTRPWDDAEQWRDLSREEQSAALDAGLADLRGEQGDGAWRHRSEREQRETIAAIERDTDAGSQARSPSDAERAMQAALEQTWTAEIFTHDDAIPTVPFECRELTGAEQAKLQEAGRIMMSLEERAEQAAGDVALEELEAVDIDSDHFDEVSDLDDWIPDLLGDVVVADEFDAERFRTGERLRSNTRRELFMELFVRYEEEIQRAQEFRQESSRT